jgi:hypothetical protein
VAGGPRRAVEDLATFNAEGPSAMYNSQSLLSCVSVWFILPASASKPTLNPEPGAAFEGPEASC